MHTRFVRLFSQIALSAGCLSTQAVAQERLGPPPLVLHDISLDLARQGAEAALAACKAKPINVVVEVTDRDQNIRALLVSDFTDLRAYDLAQRNAYTVLTKGISSGDYEASLWEGRTRSETIKMITDPQFNPDHKLGLSAGAVPVMKAGAIVGVVSVSGGRTGRSDAIPYEACAAVGRDKIEAGFKASQ